MRNRCTSIAIAVVAACVALLAGTAWAGPPVSQETPKVRVAVMGFENNSSFGYWGDNLGYAAADEMVTQLVRSGKFTVVERAQLQSVLNEQDLGASGAVDPATAARIGQILGVQVMITGSITQFSIERVSGGFAGIGGSYSRAESKMDIRLVDCETGEIVAVAEGDGDKRFGGGVFRGARAERDFDAGLAQEALRPTVEDVVAQIVEQAGDLAAIAPLAGAGSIVGAGEEDTVYIDRGENFGVEEGQRFAVYRVVDEIRDTHGNVLDRVTERVGTIEIVRVLSQSSVCRIVDGEAAEGDTFRAES